MTSTDSEVTHFISVPLSGHLQFLTAFLTSLKLISISAFILDKTKTSNVQTLMTSPIYEVFLFHLKKKKNSLQSGHYMYFYF